MPFYLATADFFKLCRDRLAPDGIVALNISTVPGDDRLSRSIAGTLATQFPLVMKWPALRFNQLVLGFAARRTCRSWPSGLRQAPADLLPLTRLVDRPVGGGAAHGRLLDRRPVPRWSGSPTA